MQFWEWPILCVVAEYYFTFFVKHRPYNTKSSYENTNEWIKQVMWFQHISAYFIIQPKTQAYENEDEENDISLLGYLLNASSLVSTQYRKISLQAVTTRIQDAMRLQHR